MKLNEEHFSIRTAIIHFLFKPYDSNLNVLVFLFKYFGKTSGFISFPCFGFVLVIKLRIFDLFKKLKNCESH